MLDDLLAQLRSLWGQLQTDVNSRFDRTLPFGDYLVDRWEKAKTLGFGEGTSVYDNVLVLGDVMVGKNTWIGPNVILDGSGGLNIGDNCSISAGVQIYSHDSVKWALSGGESDYEYSKTNIGNNCYLGPNSIITKGVSVGDGCIVGANSLVLVDVPPGCRAFGSPCVIIDDK